MPIVRFDVRNDPNDAAFQRYMLVIDTDRIAAAPWLSPLDIAAMVWGHWTKHEKILTHHMAIGIGALELLPIPQALGVATDATVLKKRFDVVLNGVEHHLDSLAPDHEIFDSRHTSETWSQGLPTHHAHKATSFVVGILDALLPSMPDDLRTSPTALDTIGAPWVDRAEFLGREVLSLATDMALTLVHGQKSRMGNTMPWQDIGDFQRHALVLCDHPWGPARMWRTEAFDARTASVAPDLRALGRMIAPFLCTTSKRGAALAAGCYAHEHNILTHWDEGRPADTAHEAMNARGFVVDLERNLRAAAQQLGIALQA